MDRREFIWLAGMLGVSLITPEIVVAGEPVAAVAENNVEKELEEQLKKLVKEASKRKYVDMAARKLKLQGEQYSLWNFYGVNTSLKKSGSKKRLIVMDFMEKASIIYGDCNLKDGVYYFKSEDEIGRASCRERV